MMNIQDLQEIIRLMDESNLSELCLEEDNLKLCLKKEARTLVPLPGAAPMLMPSTPLPQVTEAVITKTEMEEDRSIYFIKSPMVGTFYVAPSPDSAPFVKVGDRVQDSSVVCILEAMKVMNEIHAECSGEILEILVKDGVAVEYGQPLFKVRLN